LEEDFNAVIKTHKES